MQPDAKRPDAFDRRQLLVFGGTGLTLAAVLAACGGTERPDPIPEVGELSEVSELPTVSVSDATLLRTAASLVRNAIDVYDTVADLGVLSDEAAEVAALFRSQHAAHAELLDEATVDAGGEPYTEPNPAVERDVITPALQLIADNGNQLDDVLRFAHAVETLAVTTHQQFVELLHTAELRQLVMEIGGVEARHATVLASFIEGSTVLGEDVAVPTEPAEGETEETTETTAVSVVSLPVAQVPTTFSPLTAVQVSIGDQILTINTPGPNSYAY